MMPLLESVHEQLRHAHTPRLTEWQFTSTQVHVANLSNTLYAHPSFIIEYVQKYMKSMAWPSTGMRCRWGAITWAAETLRWLQGMAAENEAGCLQPLPRPLPTSGIAAMAGHASEPLQDGDYSSAACYCDRCDRCGMLCSAPVCPPSWVDAGGWG